MTPDERRTLLRIIQEALQRKEAARRTAEEANAVLQRETETYASATVLYRSLFGEEPPVTTRNGQSATLELETVPATDKKPSVSRLSLSILRERGPLSNTDLTQAIVEAGRPFKRPERAREIVRAILKRYPDRFEYKDRRWRLK